MKKCQPGLFFKRLAKNLDHFPISAQLELTRRCGFDCVHCYCKGSEDKAPELTTKEWKDIIDVLKEEGCFNLTFTGGDPLIRKDFLEIYAHAKKQGFLITVFTNGVSITDKILKSFVESPPVSIEITLNGITPETYEAVTQVPGSFAKVMRTLDRLKENDLMFILKSNCLKQNKNEIGQVKAFTAKMVKDIPCNKFRFKYDPFIFPRENGDKTPTHYRLSPEEIVETRKQDPDIWEQYQEGLKCSFPKMRRGKEFMYFCDSWMQSLFVNADGRFKFCSLSDKFSFDLKTTTFKEGFYKLFPRVLNEKFKTNSPCKECSLRMVCHYCPARAYLETGNEEGPVPYYCELAKATYAQMKESHEDPVV